MIVRSKSGVTERMQADVSRFKDPLSPISRRMHCTAVLSYLKAASCLNGQIGLHHRRKLIQVPLFEFKELALFVRAHVACTLCRSHIGLAAVLVLICGDSGHPAEFSRHRISASDHANGIGRQTVQVHHPKPTANMKSLQIIRMRFGDRL